MKNPISLLLILFLASCSSAPTYLTTEPITIKFTSTNRSIDYSALAQDFQKSHPNINIDLSNLSFRVRDQGTFLDALREVDVVRIRMDYLQPETLFNFLDLSPLIDTDRNFKMGDFFPGIQNALKKDGIQIGIPAGFSPYVVYYEPARFLRMGVNSPSLDWTINDFETTALAINDQGSTAYSTDKFTYGFCSVPESIDILFFTYLFGGGLVDDIRHPSRPTLNTTENVQALQWYAHLYQDLKVMPPEENNANVHEYTDSWICGLWIELFNTNLSSQDGTHTAAMLPLPATKASFSAGTVDGYFIIKHTAHPSEAWQWLNYLTHNQAASGGQIPPMRSLASSDGYKARISSSAFQIANNLPENIVIFSFEMQNDERIAQVYTLYLAAVEQIVYDRVNPMIALTDAQTKAEEIFMRPTAVIPTPTP